MKVYEIQKKNGIMLMSFIIDNVWNPSTCNCECNKACKIHEYLVTRKHLFGSVCVKNVYLVD